MTRYERRSTVSEASNEKSGSNQEIRSTRLKGGNTFVSNDGE